MARSASALLYSGVTAASSVGDGLDDSLKLREPIASGRKLGAELFICGPMFTAEGGHGTEYIEHLPAAIKDTVKAQLVRTPKTPEEAREQVRELKTRGVDGIKAILESGWGDGKFYTAWTCSWCAPCPKRRARRTCRWWSTPATPGTWPTRWTPERRHRARLLADEIPDGLFERMAADGVYLDPTLGVVDAFADYFDGKADVLNHSLVQQVVPARLLKGTASSSVPGRAPTRSRRSCSARARHRPLQSAARLAGRRDAGDGQRLGQSRWCSTAPPCTASCSCGCRPEFRRRWRCKPPPTTPRDCWRAAAHRSDPAGHGRRPAAGGRQPAQEIAATERISLVVYKGERIRRSTLFDQK